MDRKQHVPEGAQNFKARGRRTTAPRFDARVELPAVPEGKILVKFHGKPAFISEAQPGDEMFGKTRFTVSQIEDLKDLEQKRLESIRKELTQGRDLYL